jgi:hypothetical protein
MILTSIIALSVASSSPTYALVDSNELNAFKDSDIVASPADEKTGFYVFKDNRLEAKTLNKALDILRKVDVPYLFKKEADGKVAAWRLDGRSETIKPKDVPLGLLRDIKANCPVLKLEQTSSYHPMGLPRANVLYNVRSNLVVDNLKPQHLTTFMPLGQSNSPFVKVLFRMHVPLEVGKIKPVPGTSKVIDGIEFKVSTAPHSHSVGTPIDETKIFHCNVVIDQMTKSKDYPNQSYAVAIKVDEARYKADFPSDTSKEYSYCSAHMDESSPQAARFYVHSNRPEKYWKEVTVTQSSFLEGYVGHLPTSPIQ